MPEALLFPFAIAGLAGWAVVAIPKLAPVAPLVALIVILALWIAIAMTIFAFRKVSRLAAVLLVPYLAWVTLATALNHAIWRLNA